MPADIRDYALIGDCETAALVSSHGSIDWLCWPNFSSEACFAALLGKPSNGYWGIAPAGHVRSTRRYRDHTLILDTTFECEKGKVRLTDFMPVRGKNSDVVRLVTGLGGRVPMRMELKMRFGYGFSVPWVTPLDEENMRIVSGPNLAVLRTSTQVQNKKGDISSEFTIKKGETVAFILTYGDSAGRLPTAINPRKALRDTENFWKKWVGKLNIQGQYVEAVERSLITLKALTYGPTGGIVAAPTTSLPEQIGGQRNWDYRYCWLRDATFTLLAFMNAGCYGEAKAWRDWLLRAAAGSPDQMQIMYGIRGERNLLEWEVSWLEGHEKSTPVRVGNAASQQLQLDVYGEVGDALLHAHLGGMKPHKPDLDLLSALTHHLSDIWQQPDRGIWEVRGDAKQFTYSKVMAWVAFDRAIKNAECFGLEGNVPVWREIRDKIHAQVCNEGWNDDIGAFTQYYGSSELDASLLLLPMLGFLPVSDPRVASTVDAIGNRLMRDGFLLRYDTGTSDDGLPPGEGAFLACTFWLVEVLSMLGRRDEACKKFQQLLALRNDVGLLAEEYDVQSGRLLGNFPQALSHIALVNAALELKKGGSAEHRRRSEVHQAANLAGNKSTAAEASKRKADGARARDSRGQPKTRSRGSSAKKERRRRAPHDSA